MEEHHIAVGLLIQAAFLFQTRILNVAWTQELPRLTNNNRYRGHDGGAIPSSWVILEGLMHVFLAGYTDSDGCQEPTSRVVR